MVMSWIIAKHRHLVKKLDSHTIMMAWPWLCFRHGHGLFGGFFPNGLLLNLGNRTHTRTILQFLSDNLDKTQCLKQKSKSQFFSVHSNDLTDFFDPEGWLSSNSEKQVAENVLQMLRAIDFLHDRNFLYLSLHVSAGLIKFPFFQNWVNLWFNKPIMPESAPPLRLNMLEGLNHHWMEPIGLKV